MGRGAKHEGRLTCLDGLRGLAAILVVLFHLSEGAVRYHPAIAAAFTPFWYGLSGGPLLLVLSGFVLTHSRIRRAAAGRAMDFRTYLIERWWRIGPPYYAALAIYLAFSAVHQMIRHPSHLTKLVDARQVVSHVLFLHGLWADTIYAINIPFWMMSTLFQFYLVFPLLFTLSQRWGYCPIIIAVAALSLAFRGAVASAPPGLHYLADGIFLGRWTEFALGMGVASWYASAERECADRVPWAAFAAAVALLGVALASQRKTFVPASVLVGAGYAALLIATLLSTEHGRGPGRLAEQAALVWVGRISYSLYLTHSLFLVRGIQVYRLLVPRPNLATDAALVVTLVTMALVGGWAFYHLVERRFARTDGALRGPEPVEGPGLPRPRVSWIPRRRPEQTGG